MSFFDKFPPQAQQSCKNCYYAIATKPQPNGRIILQCRMNSPQPSPTHQRACWPIVTSSEWCGHWHPADTEQDGNANQ